MSGLDEKKLEEAEDFRMPWGQYRGKCLESIPNGYIRWLSENGNDQIAGHADIIRRWREKYGIEIE